MNESSGFQSTTVAKKECALMLSEEFVGNPRQTDASFTIFYCEYNE